MLLGYYFLKNRKSPMVWCEDFSEEKTAYIILLPHRLMKFNMTNAILW